MDYIAQQAPLSVDFFRQEYWSGKPFPSPRYPPNSGIEASSPALQADSLRSEPSWEPSFHLEVPLKQAGEQVRDAGVS